ncbi:MAG: transglutaminase-like domain-containing protein [Nitriliruptorales bacterium]|nr:transglutaminase-like domain-containing protein [Nitriliruptorales bacterium]
MSADSRKRLARVVRRPDADLAEAALLCCVEAEPNLDVDVALLRLDALADALRAGGFASSDPVSDATALRDHLVGELEFTGDLETFNDPANALLSRVLDRRRGLPITLSILWVSIGRRLGVPIHGIGLPGHFVVGIGDGNERAVVDPFHGGAVLDELDMARLVARSTGNQVQFRRNMLRPASPPLIVRRLLNNLTRDYQAAGDARAALWSVDLKLLLPAIAAEDHRARGELLLHLGQFDEAADALETYLEVADAPSDGEEIRRRAINARARLN